MRKHLLMSVVISLACCFLLLTGTAVAKSLAILTPAPDLVENTVAVVGGTQTAGGTVQVSDTVLNQGTGSAGGSTTGFYISTNGTTTGAFLGYRYVGTLAVNATSVSASTTLTLPANLTGTNYVIACANFDVESNTAHNCKATGGFTVAGANHYESAVTLLTTPTSGGSVQIKDTVTNESSGTAASSTTGFYLSTNATAKEQGIFFGYRYVGALSANASSTATVTLTLPGNLSGTYYVIACANFDGGITETSTVNNCAASAPFNIVGADLTETTVSTNPAAVLPGGTLAITDTTADAFSNVNGSTTRYYLSTTMNLVKTGSGAAVLLGSRSVPALTPTTTSTGTASVTVAASTVAGNYYVFACANDTGSVAESNTTNNCTPTPVVVYTAANTVFVDQKNINASDTSCGTSAIPCRTITEGLAAAKAGQTVLVNTGSYAEQLSITKNVTLTSTVKNAAVVQAPAAMTADSNGLHTLVNVGGGATSVSIVNMGVSGPGPGDCDSIDYGIFVTNANATIVGNKVVSIRDTPYGGCQSAVAIEFGAQGLFVGHTGTIAYNTVSDYQKGGIVVDGTGTNVSVLNNTVIGQNIPAVNGQNGIQISDGALSLVNGNTVTGNIYGTSLGLLSADGILLYDVVGGVTVTNNTASGNDEGIGIYTDTSCTTQTATNETVKYNQAINNVYLGIHIDPLSSGNTIWNNTATGNGTWDELDEHPDFTYNNWGTIPSQYNTLGTAGAHAGLVFGPCYY